MKSQILSPQGDEIVERRSESQETAVKTSRTAGAGRSRAHRAEAARTAQPKSHQASYTNLKIKGGRSRAQRTATVADEHEFDEDKARENLRLIDHILQRSG